MTTTTYTSTLNNSVAGCNVKFRLESNKIVIEDLTVNGTYHFYILEKTGGDTKIAYNGTNHNTGSTITLTANNAESLLKDILLLLNISDNQLSLESFDEKPFNISGSQLTAGNIKLLK